MYCIHCGSARPDDHTKFCPGCGKPGAPSLAVIPTPPIATIPIATSPTNQTQVTTKRSIQEQVEEEDRKRAADFLEKHESYFASADGKAAAMKIAYCAQQMVTSTQSVLKKKRTVDPNQITPPW